MASNKIIEVGPAFISNAAANILNCAITSLAGPVGITLTQPYLILTRLRIVNVGASAAFTLYIGATGGSTAGTEFLGKVTTVPVADAFEWYGRKRLTSAQFLTGIASAASTLVIEMDAEIGFS